MYFLRHDFSKLSAVPATCRRERDILKKISLFSVTLLGSTLPIQSSCLGYTERRKTQREVRMVDTIVRKGKGEELRKLTTTTAKFFKIFIFSLSWRINYLGCSHHVVKYSKQDLSHSKRNIGPIKWQCQRHVTHFDLLYSCYVGVHVTPWIILESVLFPVISVVKFLTLGTWKSLSFLKLTVSSFSEVSFWW